jgi:hypothetical protein
MAENLYLSICDWDLVDTLVLCSGFRNGTHFLRREKGLISSDNLSKNVRGMVFCLIRVFYFAL